MSREYMAPSHEVERLILGVPEELQAYRHFVGWEERPRQNKTTKVPLNPRTGYYADVTDPSTWGSFKQAIDTEEHPFGIAMGATPDFLDAMRFSLEAAMKHVQSEPML